MEEQYRIDLTYITERIITIFCPPECPEEVYLQNLREIVALLRSKHGHNYMVRWNSITEPQCGNTLMGPAVRVLLK